jgi:hypothetical protein
LYVCCKHSTPLTREESRCCRHEMKPCNPLSGRIRSTFRRLLAFQTSPSTATSHSVQLRLYKTCCWSLASTGADSTIFFRATPLQKHDSSIMPEISILQRLEACDVPVDIQSGGLVTLEPEHHTHAVSLQLRTGEHCFVLMGTGHGSAISMAKIAAIETSGLRVVEGQPTIVPTDVDYMVSVRIVLGACFKRPAMFHTPVGWLFSSDLNDPWRTIIQQRISTVLQHLHIELKVGQQYHCSKTSLSTHSVDNSRSVTAICHAKGLCEVYVEECLANPVAESGAPTFGNETWDCESLIAELPVASAVSSTRQRQE